MINSNWQMLLGVLCSATLIQPLEAQQDNDPTVQEIKFEQKWNGPYPVASLSQFPKGQEKNRIGFIGDGETFQKIWLVYQPKQKSPEIDFDKQLVIFAKNVRHLNKIDTTSLKIKDGTLVVLSTETKTAIPVSDKVYCSMVLVNRAGIAAIQTLDGKILVKK